MVGSSVGAAVGPAMSAVLFTGGVSLDWVGCKLATSALHVASTSSTHLVPSHSNVNLMSGMSSVTAVGSVASNVIGGVMATTISVESPFVEACVIGTLSAHVSGAVTPGGPG